MAGHRSGWARLAGQTVKRAVAKLLIDCEEDRRLRAVLVGMLREAERQIPATGSTVIRPLKRQ